MDTEQITWESVRNFATMCRLCLKHDGFMLAIFDKTSIENNSHISIQRKILEFMQLKISNNDGLPTNICHRCLYKVEFCADFKQQCLQSDATLRQMVGSSAFNRINETGGEQDESPYTRKIINNALFEEFTLKNHSLIAGENIENVVMVVDPNMEYDTDAESEQESRERHYQGVSDAENVDTNENIDIAEINEIKNVFMCRYCDRAFINSNNCAIHERTNHDTETPFLCRECAMSFGDRVNYTAHLKSVHKNDKPFSCPECDRSFSRRSDLRKHTVVHTGIKPFTCHICLKSFSRNTNLTKHLRIHSGHKPYVCHQCPRTFISKGDLTRHALIHSGIKPFSCRYCEQSFGRRDKLIRHEKRHIRESTAANKKTDLQIIKQQDQIINQLDLGQFGYENLETEIKQEGDSDQWETSGENMVINVDPFNHNEQHTEELLQMKDDDAERDLPRIPEHIERDVLQIPLPEHITGDNIGFLGFSESEVKSAKATAKASLLKLFSCPTCPKRFPSADRLRVHMLIHTSSSRPYACSLCPKTFMRKRECDRHTIVHTGNKPFTCKVCSKKFARKDKLLRHARVHEIRQPQPTSPYKNLMRNINTHIKSENEEHYEAPVALLAATN